MNPSPKHPQIVSFLETLFPGRKAAITNDRCIHCGGEAIEFRDALSRKEFSISGLCQACQNKIFDSECE